tara:strand:+ start:36 stop:341 length:306 start_codon:yes stop_codon:yes gene_type:complete
MNDKKNYIIELHATRIKDSAKHYATEKVCAHFRSEHKPATAEFVKDMKEAIDFYWNQQKRGWEGYVIGKLKVQTRSEPVSVMSPAWDYHKGRSFPVFEEVE